MKTGLRHLMGRDYYDEVAAILDADVGNNRDYLLRIGIVAVSGAILWVLTHEALMLTWGFGYGIITLLYVWLVRRQTAPVRLPAYTMILGLDLTLVFWYVGMVAHVTSWGGLIPAFVGCCGVVGLALHAMSNHDGWTHATMIDTTGVLIAALSVTAIILFQAASGAELAAAAVVSLCTLIYFAVTMREIVTLRASLAARRQAEVQAEKMAAVGQLSAGVAHDFNNILTVIRGNLDLVDAVENPADRQAFLDEARDASERAAHLVRQLLAFSRKSTLRPKRVRLGDAIHASAEILARVLPANVALDVTPDLPGVEIEVDDALLQAALLNAVLNARDAVQDRGGQITVYGEADAREVRLVVEDDGPGIPPDILPRVREPFFSTKPVGTGSGLGLSMIDGFARQSGGRLDVTNRPAGGAQVTIALPRAEGTTLPPLAMPAPAGSGQGSQNSPTT